MERVFKNFEATIKAGLENNIPTEAKLIILGKIEYAMLRDDLTINDAEKLEALLNINRDNYREWLEMADFGDIATS
jgi:hypothetical protein